MYSRPEDPITYLQSCLSRVHDHDLGPSIHWNSFLPEPPDPVKPAFSGASDPLPPIQSSKEARNDAREAEPVRSPVTGGLNSSAPLPPIGASSVSEDSQKRDSVQERRGARVVFVLGR